MQNVHFIAKPTYNAYVEPDRKTKKLTEQIILY